MARIKQVFYMTKTTFLEEQHNKRVIMGFILGIALFGYWLNLFLQYALDIGEPVNVLEAFVVVEHHHKSILFLVVGWLLIISDAPFIKKNTYLLLCRSSRKQWDAAMLQYIMIQAFLYVAGIVAVSVAVSTLLGFWGNMWSSPVYNLAMDTNNHLGVKYNISFPWVNIMQTMTVPQAFMITFVFLFLYLVLIGFLLYVCNLLLKEIYGRILITTRGSCIFISNGKSNSRICHRWKWWTMESCSFVLRYHIDFGVDFFVVNWTGRF